VIEHANPIQGLPKSVCASVRFAIFLFGVERSAYMSSGGWEMRWILEGIRKEEANDGRLRCGDATRRDAHKALENHRKRRL
jgi:hypothetical protein